MAQSLQARERLTTYPTDVRSDWKSPRVLLPIALAIFLLAIVGFWTHHAVREYLHESLEDDLTYRLDTALTALTYWARHEKNEIQSWAASAQVHDSSCALASIANRMSNPKSELLQSDDQAELQALLRPETREAGDRGFLVTTRSGMIVASDDAELIGVRLSPLGATLIGEAFTKSPVLSPPHWRHALCQGRLEGPDTPILLVSAVIGEDDAASVLTFLLDPSDHLTRVLSPSPHGAGVVYAFNSNGVLLSESRNNDELREFGLIPDTPESRSALTIQIRDPGGDLTTGYRPPLPLPARPFTTMAVSALAGGSGVNLEGYRDYRGVEVVGAWTWLPESGIGVAAEIPLTRAYGPLRPLRLAFWGLFFLLAIATGVVLLFNARTQRLQRRIDHIRQLGQYTLEEKIGEGGMGEVYRARHAMLRRPTAIKLLKPDAVSPEAIARFEREVQSTAQLTCPHTIEIYDFGRTPEGVFYYAMEYLSGLTLDRLIEMDACVPPARVICILRQVCESLEEAHANGLIHRDIKPPNIMLCRKGMQADFVKVLDFGLAKELAVPDDPAITAPQVVHGTPLYMAPERLLSDPMIDGRSDIYSLGVVAFNLLTGKDVFTGRNSMELCHHVMHTPARRVSEVSDTSIPGELDQLVTDCLEKEPDRRPADISTILSILDSVDLSPWTSEKAAQWWHDKKL